MSIRKRGKAWWIDFTTPNGSRVRQSAGTSDRAAAQELHDSLRAKAWRVARIGDQPSRSWDEVALRYLAKYPNRNKATHIRHFTTMFRGRTLGSLTEEDCERALNGLARPYSHNRHAATLRHLFTQARDEWKWLAIVPRVPKLTEPKGRVEFLTASEASALVDALPDQHRDLVRFALATGLRLGNILGMTWQQVDAERKLAWIHSDQAKAKRAIAVPLNQTAIEVLARQDSGTERVFQRKRIETKVWKRALKVAGITRRIRFHDLRHTWASWHAQQGTDQRVLQELGGWASSSMVQRYAHLNAGHLAVHAGNIEAQLRHRPSDSNSDKVT
jgi:integrase